MWTRKQSRPGCRRMGKRRVFQPRLEQLEDRRVLATMMVTTLDDAGPGSLREAITDANALPGADLIEFDAGLIGTIQLTSGELTIADSTSISGPGAADLSIDAGGLSRVFYIDDGVETFADVEISNVTITGGQSNEGGGIQSFENLSLEDLVVTNNEVVGSDADGGGIGQGNESRPGGTLTISASQILNNVAENDAAAIDFQNSGDLIIRDSMISGNQSGDPLADFLTHIEGAVRVAESIASGGGTSTVEFDNVTVADNVLLGNGLNYMSGAGVSVSDSIGNGVAVQISNSLIEDNRHEGGGSWNYGGGLMLEDVASATLSNTTVRGNSGDLAFVGGGIYARNSTLAILESTVSGNTARIGGGILVNGGTATVSDSLVSGNMANGSGTNNGGGIWASNATLAVSNSTLDDNTISDSGAGIWAADSTLLIEQSTISGNSITSLFGSGGGIRASNCTTTLYQSTVDGNYLDGTGKGAGIWVSDGSLSVSESLLSNNHTSGYGGGIRARNTEVLVAETTISGNRTGSQGGGIWSQGATTLVTDSLVTGNWSAGNGGKGGGIFGEQMESLLIERTTVSNNRTEGPSASGGGIYSRGGNITVSDSLITGNSTSNLNDSYGGGIAVNTSLNGSEMAVIKNSTISANITASFGGGIFNVDGLTVVQHSTVTGNTAPVGQGSGVFSHGVPAVQTEIRSSIVAGNVNSDVDFAVLSGTPVNTFFSSGYNLIGAGNALAAFTSNDLTNVANAMLGPLADNGGPTFTHALLPDSPAIDAGDPAAMAGIGDTPESDQRGMSHGRVEDGDGDSVARIDIGSFELQPVTPVDGDFNDDGAYDLLDIDALVGVIAGGSNDAAYDLTGDSLVDLADRDAWLAEAAVANGVGSPYKLGDADLNGTVDGLDFIAWNANKFTDVALWSAADFTANGTVDGADFIEWNANKFTSSDSMVLPRSVPISLAADESSSDVLLRTESPERISQDNHHTSLGIQNVSKLAETDGMKTRRVSERTHRKLVDRHDLLLAAAFASWADNDTAWSEQLGL